MKRLLTWPVYVALLLALLSASPALAAGINANATPGDGRGGSSGASRATGALEREAQVEATPGVDLPTVESGDILDLTATGALILGEVTADGGATVTERGAVYGTAADPVVETDTAVAADIAGTGAFSVTLASLAPDTLYYVRTYARNAEGVAYGATCRFATPVSVATVAVGSLPQALDVNRTTNKIYVANKIGNSVSVIDGRSDSVVATVAVGRAAYSVAVNERTNRIYVANNMDNTVSVIDGSTDSVVATITAGSAARAVAVNEETNTVYVTNFMAASVSVIDGATNTVSTTVTVGSRPIALAIDETTNKIYVANYYGDSVSVIDGASNTVAATVTVGTAPRFVAVNQATHLVYVADYRGANVIVIDGSDNSTETVATGGCPWAIAVNATTNTVYAPNCDNVVVIDGATNITQTVTAGEAPQAVAANEVTNQIYVGNYNSDDRSVAGYIVTGIDGNTLDRVGYAVPANPAELAMNEVTDKLYVINGNSVTIITLSPPSYPVYLPFIMR